MEKILKDAVGCFLCCWREDVRAGHGQGAHRIALLFVIAEKSCPDSVAPLRKRGFTRVPVLETFLSRTISAGVHNK